MRKHNLAIIFLLSFVCLITPIHSALVQSSAIPSQGIVTYNDPGNIPSGFILKYSTGFENVFKTSSTHLNMSVDNYLDTAGVGSCMWIEGLDRNTQSFTPHSGSRSLGLQVNSTISETHRSQLDVYIASLITTDEYYYKGYYFLPSNWQMNTSDAAVVAGDYYSIADPFQCFPNFTPQIEIEVHPGRSGNAWNGQYDLDITWRGSLPGQSGTWFPQWVHNPNFPWMGLRGRWFPIEWWVKMDSSLTSTPNNDGAVKIWVDGRLVCDMSGYPILRQSGEYITIGKIYYGSMDLTPKKLWVDDVEIYGKP